MLIKFRKYYNLVTWRELTVVIRSYRFAHVVNGRYYRVTKVLWTASTFVSFPQLKLRLLAERLSIVLFAARTMKLTPLSYLRNLSIL